MTISFSHIESNALVQLEISILVDTYTCEFLSLSLSISRLKWFYCSGFVSLIFVCWQSINLTYFKDLHINIAHLLFSFANVRSKFFFSFLLESNSDGIADDALCIITWENDIVKNRIYNNSIQIQSMQV